jgi:hypothetical protein
VLPAVLLEDKIHHVIFSVVSEINVSVLGRTTPVFALEEISHANMDGSFSWSLEKLRKDFASVL